MDFRQSVRPFVQLSVRLSSVLWKNGRSHPGAVWRGRSDWARDQAGTEVWGSVRGKG